MGRVCWRFQVQVSMGTKKFTQKKKNNSTMENLIFLAVRIKSFTIELDILEKIIESNIGESNCKAIFLTSVLG